MIANTYIVGFERSGTTTLHYTLAQHPKVVVSTMKEPNFWLFDAEGNPPPEMTQRQVELMGKRSGRTRADYERLFASAASTPGHRVRPDVSPSYARFSRVVAPRIARAVPDARIVVVVRHPVDHARSLLACWLGRPPSTEELVNGIWSNMPPPNGGPGLTDHGQRYCDCLLPFYASFPRARIAVFRFEDLRGTLLPNLLRFLELDPVPLHLRHDNASGARRMTLAGVGTLKRWGKAVLPDGVLRRLMPVAQNVRSATIVPAASALDPKLRANLCRQFYGESTARLEQLTGLDLWRRWVMEEAA